MIVETTPENVERVSSLTFPNLRHVDNLRGNMAIADQIGYMVYIIHHDSDLPDQTLFSNNPDLVKRQITLFEKLCSFIQSKDLFGVYCHRIAKEKECQISK